jgi:ATP-dependent RNA helicase DDX51/DBP6
MLKEADHLEKVKRLRLGEKDLAPLLPHYEVCFLLGCVIPKGVYISMITQAALHKLKDLYTRQQN